MFFHPAACLTCCLPAAFVSSHPSPEHPLSISIPLTGPILPFSSCPQLESGFSSLQLFAPKELKVTHKCPPFTIQTLEGKLLAVTECAINLFSLFTPTLGPLAPEFHCSYNFLPGLNASLTSLPFFNLCSNKNKPFVKASLCAPCHSRPCLLEAYLLREQPRRPHTADVQQRKSGVKGPP